MKIRVRRTISIALALSLCVIFTLSSLVSRSTPIYADNLDELLKKQQELEEELARIRNEKNQVNNLIAAEEATQSNLSTSIYYLSNQISITSLTIQEKGSDIEKKETQIEVLGIQIKETQGEIKKLEKHIAELEEAVAARTLASYKNSKISPIEHFVSADSITNLIKQFQYFAAIREKDSEMYSDFLNSKNLVEFEKEQLTNKKIEVEELKVAVEEELFALEEAKILLDQQKAQKNKLLAESNYRKNEYANKEQELSVEEQRKSAELAKIMDQIALAAFGIGGEDVGQGDFIGRQGNTGYSTGSHLHFGVYKNGYSQNPYTYINNGTIAMPIASAKITQLYGMTDWATKCQPAIGESPFDPWNDCWYQPPIVRTISDPYAYPQLYGYYPYDWDWDGYPNIHNGVDWSAYDGAPITAASAGKVCYGHDGFGAQYAKIDHGEGLITVYWHLREMNLNTCN